MELGTGTVFYTELWGNKPFFKNTFPLSLQHMGFTVLAVYKATAP